VVFSLPLGADRQHLATVGAAEVDWTRTDSYTYTVRAAHYAATQGDTEFSAMSARVAGTLTEIAQAGDPYDQLRRAEGARRELAEWPSRHFGYKSAEIQETLGVLDQVIASLRAKTKGAQFDIALVAGTVPPPPVPMIAAPTLQESIAQVLRLATLSSSSSERVELLRDAMAAMDSAPAETAGGTWASAARVRIRATLEGEARLDRAYAAMTSAAIGQADRKARDADVRALTKIRAAVLSRDAKLGRQRPEQLDALLATLDQRLDAAQRLRLARDRWKLQSRTYASYRRAVESPMNLLERSAQPLADIRALAGPSSEVLLDLERRFAKLRPSLRAMTAPADLLGTHASLVSACQLADTAVQQRQRAVAENDMNLARNASAAAAGSLMLFERVQEEIVKMLEAPRLP
jgi:hypothetical protein